MQANRTTLILTKMLEDAIRFRLQGGKTSSWNALFGTLLHGLAVEYWMLRFETRTVQRFGSCAVQVPVALFHCSC